MRNVILFPLFALFFFCAPNAFACSCVPVGENLYPRPKDRLKDDNSDTIFLGRVTKIEEDKRVKDGPEDPDIKLNVTFEVERVWADRRAGADGDHSVITIRTNKYDGMCGFSFVTGGRYFVFARFMETHICTPTTKYEESDAADYFKALGEGRAPTKGRLKNEPPAKVRRGRIQGKGY
jgi:hypothetical protein